MQDLTQIKEEIRAVFRGYKNHSENIKQNVALSFIGSTFLYTHLSGDITKGIALGCLAGVKVLVDAGATPLVERIWQNPNQYWEFGKRCVVDFGISALFSSVIRANPQTSASYRLVLHAYLSYSMYNAFVKRHLGPYI